MYAEVNINLTFDKSSIQQGSIETASAKVSGDSVQKINLQKIKSQTIGDILYVYNFSPLLRKEGSNVYESEFKIIFVKVPESPQVVLKIDNEEIIVRWMPVTVSPVEVPEKLIFEQFEIPDSTKIIKWLLVFAFILVTLLIVLKVKKVRFLKNQKRLIKLNIKERILNASSYDDVVAVWKIKSEILNVFPSFSEAFKQLELTLYKFQFKPYQNEAEKDEVTRAYRDFKNSIQGGFDGV